MECLCIQPVELGTAVARQPGRDFDIPCGLFQAVYHGRTFNLGRNLFLGFVPYDSECSRR